MKVDIGFVTGIDWMPRIRDPKLRDRFDEGEAVTLEDVRGVVQDYCERAPGEKHSDDDMQAAREFLGACEDLWRREGWDPTSAATVTFAV